LTPSLRLSAMKYAARGWRLFPLKPCDKLPLIPKSEGGNGCLDATAEMTMVDYWWTNNPDANIGLHCGPGSNVFVLDIDTELPKARANKPDEVRVTGMDALTQLEMENGAIPATRKSQTGRGGLHFFFLLPRGRKLRNKVGITLADGSRASIDVRTDGGYVVLPPSIHKNGNAYAWIDERDPVDAPEWILDLIAPIEVKVAATPWNRPAMPSENRGHRKYAHKALESACATIASTMEGKHDELNRRAYVIGGYVGGGYIERHVAENELVAAGIASMGAGREHEVRRTVMDALTKGAESPIAIPDMESRAHVLPEPPAYLDEAPVTDDDFAPPPRVHVLPPPQALQRARTARPVWSPPEEEGNAAIDLSERVSVGLPKINITDQQSQDVRRMSWAALLRANNASHPFLFSTGGKLTRLIRSEHGMEISPLTVADMDAMLATVATWKKSRQAKAGEESSSGFIEINAERHPKWLAPDMCSTPPVTLPVVSQVVYAPTFDKSATMLDVPGYHPSARRWYERTEPLNLTHMSVSEAKDVLYDWLADFPFDDGLDNGNGDTSRAHALGLFLLPFVRDMVRNTPAHLIEAPTPGTGKSILAQILVSASMGRTPAIHSFPEKEEEVLKTLSAALLSGRPALIFDNVRGKLKSAAFEGALTTGQFAARILGVTGEMDVPVRTVWVLTSNNAEMNADLQRRMARIRIARLDGEPFDRSKARHPDIIQWTLDNHEMLISAGLCLIQHWIDEGMPPGVETLGSYEEWARVIGGILASAGIPGFLKNRKQFMLDANPIELEWAEFVKEWFSVHGREEVKAGDLLRIADRIEVLGEISNGKDERGRSMSFGHKLAQRKDNVIAGYRIMKKGNGYSLQVVRNP